ncbi:GIN domain-containing protein [Microbulbifer spongiae]|uniref:DUF2807 domain-containing protein n=1 Tax=Microbulbifer spongiae TaxID=2944933 RepID=A0ABY9EEM3_9GAMM|nr:DUF2807 domain-containing protein [Microbulbifer sp. MI-G]WKD50831.1 DUF2807 domain-containing protein [Microbulbifer sp. MI-G]
MTTVTKALLAPLFALVAVYLAFSALAQAQEMDSKRFDVDGFTRVSLKGSSHVEVIQGENFSVSVTGPAVAMPYAKAVVKGDTLELSVEDNRQNWFGVVTVTWGQDQEVKFSVTMPQVEGILVSGSGEASAERIEGESLDLGVSGSGKVYVNKAAAETLSAFVTGSGDLILDRALAISGEASLTGSGDLHIGSIAGEQLSAEIKGSGDMQINGRVADVTIRIMGSGDFVGRSLYADSAGGSVMGSGDIVLKRPRRDAFSVMGSGDVALID